MPDQLRALLEELHQAARREKRRGVDRGPRARDLLMVQVLAGTGLRASELGRLQVGHLELGAKPYLRVVGGKKRRPRHVDTLPLKSELATALAAWVAGRPARARVFTNANGSAMDRRRVWRLVKLAMARADMPPLLNVHSLRHYFITELASTPGISELAVAQLARVQRVDTLLPYFHAKNARVYVDKLRVPRLPRRRRPGGSTNSTSGHSSTNQT